jgi:hypothetical protein
MVGRQALALLVGVRILLSQPTVNEVLAGVNEFGSLAVVILWQ